MEQKETFDFRTANIADQATVIGHAEHLIEHALKSAGVKAGTDDEAFFLTLAKMTKDFRRTYMLNHFPDTPNELWCALKAVETLRQRVYEATDYTAEELRSVDELEQMVVGKITGLDMSGCAVCAMDKGQGEEGEEKIS